MGALLQLWILSTGLGILLSGAAGRIWQDKGGRFWVGMAVSAILGVIGFAFVAIARPRRAPDG